MSEDPALYQRISKEYDDILVQNRFSLPARDLLQMITSDRLDRVLDVGSGTGAILDRCVEAGDRFETVVGVDPSAEMLAVARQKGHEHLVLGETPGLPFQDGEFGAVLANFVLSHLDLVDDGMADIVRVLEPRGTFGYIRVSQMA